MTAYSSIFHGVKLFRTSSVSISVILRISGTASVISIILPTNSVFTASAVSPRSLHSAAAIWVVYAIPMAFTITATDSPPRPPDAATELSAAATPLTFAIIESNMNAPPASATFIPAALLN